MKEMTVETKLGNYHMENDGRSVRRWWEPKGEFHKHFPFDPEAFFKRMETYWNHTPLKGNGGEL